MWTCGRTARRLQRGHALARECAAATKKQVRFYVISAHDELPPCLQGRKVTQPHGDGGGKLWVLFACQMWQWCFAREAKISPPWRWRWTRVRRLLQKCVASEAARVHVPEMWYEDCAREAELPPWRGWRWTRVRRLLQETPHQNDASYTTTRLIYDIFFY